MLRLLGILFASFIIAGCTTTTVKKDWVATGGSKADGIVRLSIEYGELEQPETNEEQALKTATDRCVVWGYTGAEAFGGYTTTCTLPMGYWTYCGRHLMTKEYQCTN